MNDSTDMEANYELCPACGECVYVDSREIADGQGTLISCPRCRRVITVTWDEDGWMTSELNSDSEDGETGE